MSDSGERRFDVTGLQVMASVLATVTGAVAASYLGVAGTIIGAAVMSVASTAGSSIYKHYLGRTAGRLREVAPVIAAQRAAERMSAGTRTRPDHTHLDHTRLDHTSADETAPSPQASHDDGQHDGPGDGQHDRPGDRPAAGRGWARWLRGRPAWLALTVASLGIFVGVVGGITVFEAATGKPLDAVVWHRKGTGTSVGGLVGGQSSHPAAPATHRAATPHPTSSSPSPATSPPSPSPTPTSGSPSPTSSSSPSPTLTTSSPAAAKNTSS
jgi:hypothetical protein